MRNLGLLTKRPVSTTEVEDFVQAKGGEIQVFHGPGGTIRQLVIGVDQDWVFFAKDTAISNAYFDEDELRAEEAQLGFRPQAYVDLHFTSTEGAFKLAEQLVLEMQSAWDGVVDYSGAGGGLGIPPKRST